MYMPCCQIELTLQFTFIILISSRTAPPGYVYAYLSNEGAPTMCPGLLSPTRPKSATNIPQPSVPVAKVPFGTHFSGNTGIVKQKLKSWLLQNRYIICRECHYPVNSVLVFWYSLPNSGLWNGGSLLRYHLLGIIYYSVVPRNHCRLKFGDGAIKMKAHFTLSCQFCWFALAITVSSFLSLSFGFHASLSVWVRSETDTYEVTITHRSNGCFFFSFTWLMCDLPLLLWNFNSR